MHGLRDGDYQIKELVGTPVRFECLKRGECDAVPLGQPNDLIAGGRGLSPARRFDRGRAAFQFQVIAARRSLAEANKDNRRALCARPRRRLPLHPRPANRAEVIKAIVEQTGSSEDIARQTLALYFEPDRGVMPSRPKSTSRGSPR